MSSLQEMAQSSVFHQLVSNYGRQGELAVVVQFALPLSTGRALLPPTNVSDTFYAFVSATQRGFLHPLVRQGSASIKVKLSIVLSLTDTVLQQKWAEKSPIAWLNGWHCGCSRGRKRTAAG